MRLGKPFGCAAVRTLSLGSRNICGKYAAQFSRRSITVKILII
jgi:hypothetical protein